MRLVIDTNIWIHYLIQQPSKHLDTLFFDPATEILFSKELIGELIEVLYAS